MVPLFTVGECDMRNSMRIIMKEMKIEDRVKRMMIEDK